MSGRIGVLGRLATIVATMGLASGLAGCGSTSYSRAAGEAAAPAQPAHSGPEVLRQMHDRYATTWYHTLSFTQATERLTPADTLAHETWYEAAMVPGALRIDVGAPDGNPVILYTRDSLYIQRRGMPMVRRASRNPLAILGFDVYRQPVEETARLLAAEGYDLGRFHMGTWEGRAAYVVGASDASDTVSKQFWIDRDRLLFVRTLEPAQNGAGVVDIRFENYQPLAGGWIAPVVTATSGGKLIQRETYRDIKADPPIPASRFEPASLGQ